MRKSTLFGMLVLAFFVSFILPALQTRQGHDFTDKCSMCHVGSKDPTILTREPNLLCLDCHPDSEKRSHPSNFIPIKPLPEIFPLFRKKMVCVTCHFPHPSYTQSESTSASPEQGPFLLRSPKKGKLFCYTCHQGNFVSLAVDSHALATRRAHPSPPDYELRDMIDDHSRDCLSCHDGTLSVEAQTQVRGLSWEHTKNIGLSHPINVDYRDVYQNKPRFYHPPERLDDRIKLINGRIGCETCHDHYSQIKGNLVMENTMSRLCLACHNL